MQLGVSTEYAYSTILSALFGLDIAAHPQDKAFFNHYFPTMIRELDPYEYMKNPYYKNIKIPETRKGMIEYKHEKFHPFEAFVWNDIVKTKEGRQIPQIGFFKQNFIFLLY